MNASRLLIATAFSLAVAGAAGVAFAQTTTPTAPNQVQTQGQNLDQLQGQTTITTVREGTTPGSMNSTTQRPYDASTPEATTTGTRGTTGTAATRSADGTQRSAQDRPTMDTERAARAERN